MIERTYTFPNQMRMSEGASNKTELDDILLEHFPNATKVERATSSEDRNGTDRWITMHSGEKESKIFFSPIQRTPYAMGGYYKSQCVYVPRTLIWKEIYKVYGGASQRNVNPDALLIDGIQRAKDRSYATTRIEKPKLTDRERTIIDSFPVQEGLWT